MKKVISILACVSILLSSIFNVTALQTKNLFEYEMNEDGTITLIKFFGEKDDTEIVIPESIDGYRVTALGDMLFTQNEYIKSVTIPEGVTTIGHSTFGLCSKLTYIDIPASAIEIPHIAFVGCTNLRKITVNDDNTRFYDEDGVVFDSVTNTLVAYPAQRSSSYYVVPDGTVEIAGAAFYNAKVLEIVIPVSVTTIGDLAFENRYTLDWIYYTGTEADWEDVNMNSDNKEELEHMVEFDYVIPKVNLTINNVTREEYAGTLINIKTEQYVVAEDNNSVTIFDSWNVEGFEKWSSIMNESFFDTENLSISFTLPLNDIVVTERRYAIGDVNKDGVTAATDLINISTAVKEGISADNHYDINGDGIVAGTDLLMLSKIIKGDFDYSDYMK